MILLTSEQTIFTVDLTITISVILGIAAIISPVLASIINGIIQYKMKKLELREETYKRTVLRKQEVMENFIKSLSACVAHQNDQSLKEFGEYYPIAYMYFPDDVRKTMAEVYHFAIKRDWENVRKYIDALSNDVHKTIAELQSPRKRARHKWYKLFPRTHPCGLSTR